MKHMQITLSILIFWTSTSLATFTYTISDAYEPGTTKVQYDNSLLVTGAGALIIEADDSSYIEVQNTAPLQENYGGIYVMTLSNNSTLNYYNGETGGLYLYHNTSAVLQGGRIDHLGSFQDSGLKKHITFICDVDSVELNGNLLTGNWLGNRGSFSIKLEDQAGYDSVYSNIHFIPEPATLALFGLGGLILRKLKSS